MNLPDVNCFGVLTGLLGLCIFYSFLADQETLKYSQKPTIVGDSNQQEIEVFVYPDTVSNDALFLVKTQHDIPLHYFKNITTEVCFDGECRLLTITVYWNITGRYLGFELPIGEFLSKYEHEPFSNDEYERLNDLLADSNLPLGQISFEKLIEVPATMPDSVDGISGATTASVAQMVVKGAAYSTYTLWNIVHGTTQDYVVRLTEEQLTPDLIDLILKSPDISDRVWALKRIPHKTALNPKLTTALLDIISGDDFFLSYSAINAIKVPHLHTAPLQDSLFSIYKEADHSIQRMIVEKLMTAPYLSSIATSSSRKLLHKLNGKQLGEILKLYTKHSINDLETYKAVAGILKNENSFISQQAYGFLKKSVVADEGILRLLIKYEGGEERQD
ncbi:MAG: hypothetical protein ACJA01_003542 [Saprospiraceae bacterium]|jgi:hypothetical protein